MRLLALLPLFACTPDDGVKDSGVLPVGPASLAPGDVADMVTGDDGGVSLEVADAGTYIVILTSTANQAGEIHGYADDAAAGPRLAPSGVRPARPADDGVRPMAAVEGDTRQFRVWDGNAYVTIDAVATSVTGGVVVWTDQTTPNEIGEIPADTVAQVVDAFETIVMPRERQVFGEESDVDADGMVHVLLSYTVNTYGAVAYVTGCDIGSAACTGNGSEIIYMGIPDPADPYASVNGITETFAHEVNHLIYGWHKYFLTDQVGEDENIYLTEGMSALAQDLSGYNNGNQYVWAAALDMDTTARDRTLSVDSVSVNDFLRGATYYDDDRDGPLRGGAYLFLRYLFEQAGGMDVEADGTLVDAGGMAWLHDWFDNEALGPECVVATTGREVDDIALDWYTAIVVTGRVENDNPAWNFQDRVEDPLTGYSFGVDPYANIHGHLQLEGPLVQSLDNADGELRGGGVEYLEVTLDAGGTIAVPVSAEAKAVARLLRVE